MTIENCTANDIEEIFSRYRVASDFMKTRYSVSWPEFERQLVVTEIAEQRQWKMLDGNDIACLWATTFDDPQIWEERNADPSVYIHRIATDTEYRGQKLVEKIVGWAKGYAKEHGKKYIRLDTVGENTKLISHYQSCGFDFLGLVTLKDTRGLPSHYGDGGVCLFELAV
ncbi:MAG: family acetyltransferase [Flavipsychrobacter sp.]|nr:family acetyltransferase [Flavipsychrobacter sp.]